MQRLDRVDHAHLGPLLLERRQHRVQIGLGDHRHRQRLAGPQPLCPQPDLRRRLLGRHVQRPAARGAQVGQHHRRQRRLADPGRAADQHQRAGHDPAAEDVVELADAGAQPAVVVGLHLAQRDRLDRLNAAPKRAADRPAALPGRAVARARPACSTRRTPDSVPPSGQSHGRTVSRRERTRSVASHGEPTGRTRRQPRSPHFPCTAATAAGTTRTQPRSRARPGRRGSDPCSSSSERPALRSDADRRRLGRGLDHRQLDVGILLALHGAGLDQHGRSRRDLGAQHEVGQRILDVALDRPAQRPGAHRRIPALVDEQILGRLRQLELQLALGHRLADPRQQQLDDLLDLVLGQLVEDDHLVDPVQELGPEDLLQLAHDPVLHVVVGDPGLVVGDGEPERRVARDLRGPDVRGHDHDAVAEVDRPALRVGQPAVLEDLQQDVEHVGMGLLDLVEQQHAVGLAAHRLGQLAALVVADVARRRTDQARDRVLLHVLGHVDPDHRVLVAEQELGQRPGQLGLADARRPEEDERAGRAAWGP